MKEREVKVIREIILEEARKLNSKIEKIILFGSRARGDYDKESDYDLLVIVENAEKLRELQLNIYRALGDRKIYADVIVVDKNKFEKYSDDVGFIFYYALQEGVAI